MGWLNGWDYRKSHEIEGAQTDYQIPIKVNYGEVTETDCFEYNGKHDPFYTAGHPRTVYFNGKTYVVWQGDTGYDLRCGAAGYTGAWYLNDFWIRKFVDPEPAHGDWGSEEGGGLAGNTYRVTIG